MAEVTYSAEVLPIAIQSEWGIKHNLLNGTDFPVYRFMPHRAKGEGFFLAALRKPIEEDVAVGCDKLLSTVVLKEKKNKKGKPEAQGKGGKAPQNVISRERLAALRGWIAPADDFTFMVEGDSVRAFPTPYIEVLPLLKRHLRIVQAGIELAEQKGRDWVPCHALAMSANLVANAFPTADVSLEEAIAYLRKEAITLPADTPRGIVLVTYRQMPLGFVKNIGNRANNLYPQEWRIRTTFVSLPSATNPEKSAQTKS